MSASIIALYFTIIIPLAGAFLVLTLWTDRDKELLVSLSLGLTLIAAVLTVPGVIAEGSISVSYPLVDYFNLSFSADGLAVFMAIVSSGVAFVISLYAGEYMAGYSSLKGFYFWMLLFVGSMMGLVFSANLVLIYVFWELTAVASWRLIGFYRGEEDVKAADKAFLITFFGAALLLAGIAMIFADHGTLELSRLQGENISNVIALLIFGGIISKSAQLPLQTWLPDAGVAPSPVTALLHAAVLVKIGIYVYARLYLRTFEPSAEFLMTVMSVSVITIIVGAASALVSTNIKRILAYSTISQLGYIMLALALNTETALKVAFIYILAHSLAKAGLFLCAGIVEHETENKEISMLGGLLKTMPGTATAYLLCAFSIIGIPPFLGFWPKLMVIVLAAQAGFTAAAILAAIGAVFTLFYLFRFFSEVFLGEVQTGAAEGKKSIMVYTVVFLGAVSLLLGLLPNLPFDFLNMVVK